MARRPRASPRLHIYRDNDEFTVTLLVTDDEGATGDDTMTVTVSNLAPTAEAGDDLTAAEGDTVTIAPTQTNVGLDDTHSATIDWGDNSDDTVIDEVGGLFSGQHVYADDGDFVVTVTVRDDDGDTGTHTLTVEVDNVAPVVDAGADQAAIAGEPVLFNGSFTDAGVADSHTIEWDFGDDEGVTGTLTPTHTYSDPGEFTVTLTVDDGDEDGEGTDTLQVVVVPEAVGIEGVAITGFSLSNTSPVPPDDVVVSFIAGNISGGVVAGIELTLLVKGVAEVTFPTFDLGVGESRSFSHSIARTDEGIYPVQMLDQVQAFVIEGPEFEASNFQVGPVIAALGNTVKASVNVSNVGAVVGRVAVAILVDGVAFERNFTIVPGGSILLAQFIEISRPLAGLDAPGPHRVAIRIDGRPALQPRRYTVVRPAIVSRVPTEPAFNPAETTVVDATGKKLVIETGARLDSE